MKWSFSVWCCILLSIISRKFIINFMCIAFVGFTVFTLFQFICLPASLSKKTHVITSDGCSWKDKNNSEEFQKNFSEVVLLIHLGSSNTVASALF